MDNYLLAEEHLPQATFTHSIASPITSS